MHDDHDIHGQLIEIWPDGEVVLDEDCDCPDDCLECNFEGEPL